MPSPQHLKPLPCRWLGLQTCGDWCGRDGRVRPSGLCGMFDGCTSGVLYHDLRVEVACPGGGAWFLVCGLWLLGGGRW